MLEIELSPMDRSQTHELSLPMAVGIIAADMKKFGLAYWKAANCAAGAHLERTETLSY
jgi:hypothetical protein